MGVNLVGRGRWEVGRELDSNTLSVVLAECSSAASVRGGAGSEALWRGEETCESSHKPDRPVK